MPKISIDEFMSRREKSVAGDKCFKGHIDKAGGAKFDKQARSAQFVMSTENADREGDIIRQAGWQLDNFLKNAPLPVFHNTRSWPVGSWKDVKVIDNGRPKRLEGTAQLLPEGGPVPEVDQAAWMLEHGGMKAVSVGFIPLEIDLVDPERGWSGGFDILVAELVECSLVPVPAHPDALMKDAGGDWKLARELVEEVLDNWAKDPRTGILMSRQAYENAYAQLKRFVVEDAIGEDGATGLEDLAKSAKRAEEATTGFFDRIKSLFGVKAAEEAVKEVEASVLVPSALAADILKTLGSPIERELARKAKREALEQREVELIEALKAKGRLPDDKA